MKTLKLNSSPLFAFVALALLVAPMGCATGKARQTESLLTASGFQQMSAITAEQERQLQLLPPGRVSIVKRKGQFYYVYANRARNLLFVGQQAQFVNYQNLLADQQAVADDRMLHKRQSRVVDRVGAGSDNIPSFEGPNGFDF